jgi:hypothetical protein
VKVSIDQSGHCGNKMLLSAHLISSPALERMDKNPDPFISLGTSQTLGALPPPDLHFLSQ